MFCRTIKLQNNHVYTKLWHNILYRSNFRSFWEEIYKYTNHIFIYTRQKKLCILNISKATFVWCSFNSEVLKFGQCHFICSDIVLYVKYKLAKGQIW